MTRSRFVGRATELALADQALDAAAVGRGAVLVITGEAGMGKSRLAREIGARARTRGMELVWSAGWPEGGAPAYWPWPEILGATRPPGAEPLELASTPEDAARFERFRAVVAALATRIAGQPLVIVLDDVHTIDADGLLLTRFVARSVVGSRLLLVLVHRPASEAPEHTASVLDELGRNGMSVRLRGLATDELRDLAVAHGEPEEATALQRVEQLTGGNPFLVEQVLDAGLHHSDGPVPGSARRLLDEQLDGLDAGALDILECAAVLGSGTTIDDLAGVVDCDHVTIERARERAAASGIVRAERSQPITFTHELAREAVLARLSSERLAALHRRGLAALAGDDVSPETAARRAHHALALARGSAAETEDAIEIVVASAHTLVRHRAPEAAVELLREAIAAFEARGNVATAPMLTELGSAMLATGRLADARQTFRRAVDRADTSGDSLTYAQAALGLGGVWVREHRSGEDGRTYDDIVDRAIAGAEHMTSPQATRLTASLQLRRAVERMATDTGTLDQVRKAVADVRSVDDPRALAAGLSLLHHVLLGPAAADERAMVASELLDVARACGDEFQTLMGLMWRTVDALLAGRPADRALTELRERADALGMRAVVYIADAIDVMRTMRAGDLAAAETAVTSALELGLDVGDPDAEIYFGAQLLALRWFQGRAGELLELSEQLATSTSMTDANPVYWAVVAVLAAEAGDADRAEQALAQLGRGRLHELLPTSSWMVTLFVVVEAAVALDDIELADEAAALLTPFASLPVIGSIGVCCFGSAERSLGLAARVAGRLDDAIGHLERAVSVNQRLGNRPMTAIARGDLSECLLARDRPGDRTRAAELLGAAVAAAEEMGLDARVERWRRFDPERHEAMPPAEDAECRRDGAEWELVAGDERARVPHTVGMGYLAALLAAPGHEIPVGQLAGAELVSPRQEVLDPSAVDALRRRIVELEDAIDDASLEGRADQVAALESERDELVAHARSATGLGGRSRRFDDATERARTAVQKAIRRAVDNVGQDAPLLAVALRASLHTGYRCRYVPTAGAPRHWIVDSGGRETVRSQTGLRPETQRR